MLSHNSGIRAASVNALAAQDLAVEFDRVSRKDLITAAREAAESLQLRPSSRLILGILASCYGEQKLDRGLMVWPSNDYLMQKSGLSERTIRFCIKDLIERQLVAPVDSANRKRFAIRSAEGTVLDAFGFNLNPLYARRLEFAGTLIQERQRRETTRRQFDTITICRKACEAILEILGRPEELCRELAELTARTPRRSMAIDPSHFVEAWETIHSRFTDLLRDSGSAGKNCRHQEANNDLSTDSCKTGDEEKADLELLKRACPAIVSFNEPLETEQDLIATGKLIRGYIGAHPDAWREASETTGTISAAILALMVLQYVEDDQISGQERIKNPGGLYRALVRQCAAGTLDIRNELKALKRRHTE